MRKTTDDGRIIITKRGKEISKSSYSNWDLWKLSKDLNKDELSMLITLRKNYLKHTEDPEMIRGYRRDILILEDAYKIKSREEIGIYSKSDYSESYWHEDLDELSSLAVCMINKLGYTQNTLYKENALNISRRIELEGDKELIAACIVKNILDYYESKFDINYILKLYSINEPDFYKTYIECNRWCSKHYWS